MLRLMGFMLAIAFLGSCNSDILTQDVSSEEVSLSGRSGGFYNLSNNVEGGRIVITQENPDIANLISSITSNSTLAASVENRFSSDQLPIWQWARVIPMTEGTLYRVPVYDSNNSTSAIISLYDGEEIGISVVARRAFMEQLGSGTELSRYDNIGVNAMEFALFDYYARADMDESLLDAVQHLEPMVTMVEPCEDCEVYTSEDQGDGDDGNENGEGGSGSTGSPFDPSILDQWQTSSGGSSNGSSSGSTGSQGGNTGNGGGSTGQSNTGTITVAWNPNTNSFDVVSHQPPAGVEVDMDELMHFILKFIWDYFFGGGSGAIKVEIQYVPPPDTDADDASPPTFVIKDNGLQDLRDALEEIGAVSAGPVSDHVYIDCGQDDVVGSGVSSTEGVAQAALSWNDLFNISCDKLKCLLENQDLFDTVSELASNDLIDPCNTDATTEDIMSTILDNMGEDCSLEGFEEAWDGVSKIDPDPTFNNCQKVKCVYDLLDIQNNGLFCSTFGELFDSDAFTLELFSVPRSSISWNADGATSFNGTNISIEIANDLCDGDTHPLDIASTLLHEAIHAAMYQSALNGNPDLNSTDYCLIWQDHFQTDDPCHEVMANQYVEHLAQAIADLDGNRFSLDHYMYSAWAGLSSVGDQLGLLLDPYTTEYYDEYQVLMNSPFDECR